MDQSESMAAQVGWSIYKKAFEGVGIDWQWDGSKENSPSWLEATMRTMDLPLGERIIERKGLKVQFVVQANFLKSSDPSIRTVDPVTFPGKMVTMYEADNVLESITQTAKSIWGNIALYEENGSGWILDNIKSLNCNAWQMSFGVSRKNPYKSRARPGSRSVWYDAPVNTKLAKSREYKRTFIAKWGKAEINRRQREAYKRRKETHKSQSACCTHADGRPVIDESILSANESDHLTVGLIAQSRPCTENPNQ